MKILLSALISLAMLALSSCNKNLIRSSVSTSSHWDYENTNWASEGYSDCAGKVQSPIDIVTANTIKSTALNDVAFFYTNFPMHIIDNGHAIQINVTGNNSIAYTASGSSSNTPFQLKQFHFHCKGEHTIDGIKNAAELHLVHQDPTTGDLLVIGVFLTGGATGGSSSSTILMERILNGIPAKTEQEVISTTQLNMNDILPSNKLYYTYTGSLTTPPCSQGVTFLLYKTPVSITDAQITVLKNKYDHDARPTQPLNNRIVLEKTNP